MSGKTIKERETEFGAQVKEFLTAYSKEMLTDFFYYWTEPNKSQTKMKFEMEKTWDISRRLRTWERNNQNWKRNGTATNQQSTGTTKSGTSTDRTAALQTWGVKPTGKGGEFPTN